MIKILDEAAGALAEAHALNLIHRDIKPGNLMLVEQGGKPDVLKVLDFGLVKELDRTDDLQLTEADRITGTPQYLPPEAVTTPDKVDARSDLYALGAIGYFLLTGHHVFEGETVVEVCAMHLHSNPVPPSERVEDGVPEDLDALILQCLAKSPQDRPQTSLELQKSLRGCADCGGWSEEQAKVWWATHRDAVDDLQAHRTIAGGELTLAIKLSGRGTAPQAAETEGVGHDRNPSTTRRSIWRVSDMGVWRYPSGAWRPPHVPEPTSCSAHAASVIRRASRSRRAASSCSASTSIIRAGACSRSRSGRALRSHTACGPTAPSPSGR